jgi:hypothetical protein
MHLFFEQMYFIGNKSLFIIILTSTFSGMVFCLSNVFGVFKLSMRDSLVGPVVAISIAKELAPVFFWSSCCWPLWGSDGRSNWLNESNRASGRIRSDGNK